MFRLPANQRGQFYTANVKQTVQSVRVDVLGSTALVGQDVHAKPSLCQNPHSARDDVPCRDCCSHTDITPGAHCIPTLQKQVGCFNHRVVTLVSDKLKKQWL